MSQRGRKVTSFEVARHAGVSRAAVSRTYSEDASISDETREKVRKSAKELGYRVNYLARSLTNQRSDLVGVVVADMDNPFRALQVDQIARALLESNFRPILLPTDNERDPAQVIDQLLHYNVSGVIVTSDAPPNAVCEECAADGVPIVLINKDNEIPGVDRVLSDNEAAGKLAAITLIEEGVERPFVMRAISMSFSAQQRSEAFITQCAALGVECGVIQVANNDYNNGFEHAEELVRLKADSLFCFNDYMACGVVDRLVRDFDMQTPRDIKIIGHDDIPQASWAAYELTTIRQPCDVQARQAIEFLISRMSNEDLPVRVEYTPVSLIRRRTA